MDILIGFDGSDCAQAALASAIDLAKLLGDRVVIAYADAPPDRLRGEEWKEHHKALHEMGESETAKALAKASEAGVDAAVELVSERPVDALLGLASRGNVRLIVVGTHGERPLTSAILGSVPHKLLHRSQIPVLVVPATA